MNRAKKKLIWLFVLMFLGCLLLNVSAFLHVRQMTHFVDVEKRTPDIESLSLWQKGWVLLTGVQLARPANTRNPLSLGIPFQTKYLRSYRGRRLEVWVLSPKVRRGRVLLFHGYAGHKSELLEEAAVFYRMGYEAILTDFPGSGGSEGKRTTIGYHEAHDVAAVVKAFPKMGAKPLVLFGFSMGAAAVLRYVSLNKPSVDALVLSCPFDSLLHAVKNRFSLMGLPSFPAAHLIVLWGGVQLGMNGFAHRPSDYASHVHVPTLLVQGDRDARVTLAQSKHILTNLAGKKKWKIFRGEGHGYFARKRPLEWKLAISSFLLRSIK